MDLLEPTRSAQSAGSLKDWVKRCRLSPLERRVFLVAVAGLLPVAILSCISLITAAQYQKERLLQANQDTMTALVAAVDAELKSTIAALDALAASPRLAAGDFNALYKEARELLHRRAAWMNVVVAGPDAQQLMNSQLPIGSQLPRRIDTETINQVVQTGSPVIGPLVYSPVQKMHGFAVLVPFMQEDKVKYVLTAVIRPDSLLDLLRQQSMPEHGVISVVETSGRIVTRSMDHEQWLGRRPSEQASKLLKEGAERGWAVTQSYDKRAFYSIYSRSSFSGWSAIGSIPRGEIDGSLARSYMLFGGSIVLSVLLGLIAALLVGRTIVNPMRQLEESAGRVGRGEAPQLPKSGLSEIRRIGVALMAAHSEREQSFLRERDARVAAESASRAKDEFLAMLGHELRNPLAAITTASTVMEQNRPTLDPMLAHAARIIERQTKHLSHLTDDLLDAGRVMMGKIALHRIPMDLAAAVRTTLEGLRSTGRLNSHHVTTQLEPVWVNADPTRMDQVISNLLTNAAKYTPSGGSITITVRREGEQALLEVRDTGIGMDPDLVPRVFDLFVQGERSLDRSQGGLGIGLTLVHRLTELHEGNVRAESSGVGQGATFTVRLRAIEPAPMRAAMPGEKRALPALCIAIVEDNADVRDSMRMLLELDGHEVHVAADGVQGLELLLTDDKIEFAFIDIGLPGMDGYALARAVRAHRNDVHMVATSGYGSEMDKARAREVGFAAYLVKPVDAQQMRNVICHLLEAAAAA